MPAHRQFDGVIETTNTVGAGDRVLAGAKLGFQTVLAAGAVDGDVIPFSIRAGAEWEDGLYRYNAGANSLTPVKIEASSNAGAAVAFSAGVKDVVCGPLARHIQWPLGAIPETIAASTLMRINVLRSALTLTARGYCSKITDISGNGRDSDLNTTNPPKLVHSGFNSLPALFFDGGQRHTFSTVPSLGSPLACTLWGIGSAWGAPSGNSHIYNWAGNPIGFSATTSLEFMYNGTLPGAHPDSQGIVQEHTGVVLLGYPVFFIHIYNGAASVNNVNGSRQTGFNPGTVATGSTNKFTIGSDASGAPNASAGSYNRMLLHEFGVANRAISAAEETQLAMALRAIGRLFTP
jgi:hypothetical protein